MDKDGNITKTEVVDKDDNIQIVMEFKTQEFNKKFDKNYFELSELLSTNTKKEAKNKNSKEESNTNNQNQSPNQNETTTNPNNSSSNNTATNNSDTNTNENQTSSTTNQTQTDETAKETKQTATNDDVIYPMYLPANTYLTNQDTIDTENGQRLILTFGGDSSFILVEETINTSEEGLIIPVSGEFDFLSDVIGVISTNSLTWHSNGIEYYMVSDTIPTSELVEIARSISVLPVSK